MHVWLWHIYCIIFVRTAQGRGKLSSNLETARLWESQAPDSPGSELCRVWDYQILQPSTSELLKNWEVEALSKISFHYAKFIPPAKSRFSHSEKLWRHAALHRACVHICMAFCCIPPGFQTPSIPLSTNQAIPSKGGQYGVINQSHNCWCLWSYFSEE